MFLSLPQVLEELSEFLSCLQGAAGSPGNAMGLPMQPFIFPSPTASILTMPYAGEFADGELAWGGKPFRIRLMLSTSLFWKSVRSKNDSRMIQLVFHA